MVSELIKINNLNLNFPLQNIHKTSTSMILVQVKQESTVDRTRTGEQINMVKNINLNACMSADVHVGAHIHISEYIFYSH